jgi:hypothetical protein
MRANLAQATLTPGSLRASTVPQSLDQIFPGFSESLAAASKASSQADSSTESDSKPVRRQKANSGDGSDAGASDSSAASTPALAQIPIPAVPTIPVQPNVQVQNVTLDPPSASPTQATFGLTGADSASAQIAGDQAASASTSVGSSQTAPVVTAPFSSSVFTGDANRIQGGGDSSQTTTTLQSDKSQSAGNQITTIPMNGDQATSKPQTTGSDQARPSDQNAIVNVDPGKLDNAIATTAGSQDSSTKPELSSSHLTGVATQASSSDVKGTTPKVSSSVLTDAKPKASSSDLTNGKPVTSASDVSGAVQASATAPNKDQSSTSDQGASAPNASEGSLIKASLDAILSGAANAAQSAISNAIPNAVSKAPLNVEPVPAFRAELSTVAKGVVASGTTQTSSGQSVTSSTGSAYGAIQQDSTIPSATVTGAFVPNWLVSGLRAASQSAQSSQSGVQATKPSDTTGASNQPGTGDSANLKTHASSADQTMPQGVAQTAPIPTGSLVPNVSQGQAAVLSQTTVANAVVATTPGTQNPIAAQSVQGSGPLAVSPEHIAKAQMQGVVDSTAASQTLPVINSARLIQSMGQTEMRVGMRSSEFGSISISTSATRDLISAQISVDHGELAKTLAAHLPEMQARLGSNQAMDVRIDMNGTATGTGTGQGAGTFSNMQNSSSDNSQGNRQQGGNTASTDSGNGTFQREFVPAVAAPIAGDSMLSSRLDIRV